MWGPSFLAMFIALIQTFEEADEITQKMLNRIIADLLVDFTSVAASAPGGSDETSSTYFGRVRARCGAKYLACCDA
jgi:hypothetical protein